MSENVTRTVTDLPALPAEQQKALIESLQKRLSAPTGDRVKITQFKKFRLPDGLETDQALNAVVVDFVASNVFYEDMFDKDEMGPPDCFAIHAEPALMVPSEKAPKKQGDTCSRCSMNQWGSGPRGKGKACKNTKLLAILPADADATTPLWVIQVSPTGIKFWEEYTRGLVNRGIAPSQVVTEISFDSNVDYPSLRFKSLRPLEADEYTQVVGRATEAHNRLHTEPDVSGWQPKPARSGRR